MGYLLDCFANVLNFQPYAGLSCKLITRGEEDTFLQLLKNDFDIEPVKFFRLGSLFVKVSAENIGRVGSQ